jgi:hypothetical protein
MFESTRRSCLVKRWLMAGMIGLCGGVTPVATAAQTSAPSSGSLTILAVDVQPPHPGPDTLCKLKVRLRNSGPDAASELSFQVTVNGKRLAPYVNHTFRSFIAPGKDTEVSLYNFWSSEYGRPFPSDGRLVIEVRLTAARWVMPGSTDASTLAGPVNPLPAPFSVTLSR